MNRTLGLDLGTNSLGWAILDDVTGDVLDKGVVVFPEGANLDAGDSLDTPAATRRAARMSRRMKFRRKLRKWMLLKVLIENSMCPLTQAELDEWKKFGKYPLSNKSFVKWLKSTNAENPYCDRAAAAEGKVEPFVLGRALYHICQRRGFKSSRKEEAVQVDEATGEIKEDDKNLGAVKGDIAALTKEIEACGAKTLGQYFYKRLEDEKDSVSKTRIRCRYTGRVEHYEKEYEVIMAAQGIGPATDLYRSLRNAIFQQRPLRSQKHLVGNCPLETRSPRAQIGHPAFEEYRMLSLVNNLSFEDEDGEYRDADGNFLYPLSAEDREKICEEFYKVSSTFKFGSVIKKFKKHPEFQKGRKFHYYREDDTLPTCRTIQMMRNAFGKVEFDVQKVFDALMFYNDTKLLKGWFRKHYPKLDDAAVEKAVRIHPKEGNANYSLKAINKILPFLRKGFDLSMSRILAKLPDVIPDFSKKEGMITAGLTEQLINYRREKRQYADLDSGIRKVTPKPKLLLDRFHDYLLEWGLTEAGWNLMYLKGDEEYTAETEYRRNGKTVKLAHPRIPAVNLGMIRNPLVQRSMTTLRRLVNYLGDHGKISEDDTVRIELARSVNDFASRKAWQLWQTSRKLVREEAEKEIVNLGFAVTEDAIERYQLWKEQGGVCLYTGRSIPLAKLFGGNEFDIEHTLPRSLSGDDSLANKTICESVYNRTTKKGMVPRNCPNWEEIEIRLRPWREQLEGLEKNYRNQLRKAKGVADPAAHSQARVKALVTRFELQYWRDKLRRFDMTVDKLTSRDGELSGFKKRQLVDSGIMSSHAVALLKSVYPATFAVNGAATAFARKAWGLQGDEKKDRTEHTHHAVDAMVIAALKPLRFTAICTALKDDGAQRVRECDACPSPWPDFADKVRAAREEILVKHILRQTTLRQSSKRNVLAKSHKSKSEPGKTVSAVLSKGDTVRGQLHKDTFYGCIVNPGDGKKTFVVRKSLVGPLKNAESMVSKIVDPGIRDIVDSKIADLKAEGIKNIEPGMIKMPSGVPINKVRIVAQTTNPSELKVHQMLSEKSYKNPYYVTSAEGSNFRMGLFEIDGKASAIPDNSLDWAQCHKSAEYEPLDKKPGFLGYIRPGTMALACEDGNVDNVRNLDSKILVSRLYKVVKFRSDGLITFRYHKEARASVVLSGDLMSIGKHKAGESTVDYKNPHELLLLSPGMYFKNMIFEGIHFKMLIDGTIQFIQ